jgi:hypothetical protein
VINGIKFQVLNMSDAGMSQYMAGISYRVKYNGMCYAVEFVEVGATSGGYANSEAEAKVIDEQINQRRARAKKTAAEIIQTFRFI